MERFCTYAHCTVPLLEGDAIVWIPCVITPFGQTCDNAYAYSYPFHPFCLREAMENSNGAEVTAQDAGL